MKYGICMYVFSCGEGREGSVPPSQCLTIRVLPYLFYICIYYVCSHYYTHTNGYRTHTIITIRNIVGCKLNYVQVKYLIGQSKIKYHNRTYVVSRIVHIFTISLAITVCMCSPMLIAYSYVPFLERCALQRSYAIHVVFMYNTCILVLSHYTTKGKHQGCIQNTPTMANSLFIDNLPFANVSENVMLDKNRLQNNYCDINSLPSSNNDTLTDIDPDIK